MDDEPISPPPPPPESGPAGSDNAGAPGGPYPGQPRADFGTYGQPGIFRSPARRLWRSSTNRCIAGVMGGLAEYFGVEANALRVCFVLASVVFLAGFGGVVVYAVAWALVPEQRSSVAPSWQAGPRGWCGPASPAWRRAPGSAAWGGAGPAGWGQGHAQAWGGVAPGWGHSGRFASPGPLSQPGQAGPGWPAPADRAARSWALVLAACALAIVWSFGLARWWHAGSTLAWLFVMWVAVGLFVRHRRRAPGLAPTPGNQPTAGDEPGAPAAREARPSGPAAEATLPTSRPGPEEVDWAEAQAAAASWAAEQLAAAGVPPAPGPAPSALAPPRAYPRRSRHTGAVVAALLAGLVLVVVASVVGVTVGSGAPLVGGVGDVRVAPADAAQLQAHYRLGIGRLVVDLSRAQVSAKGRRVVASVGVGQLLVVLPRDTIVYLDATSGVGSVQLPENAGSYSTEVIISQPSSLSKLGPAGARRLTVDAHVGVGVVRVSWGH